MTHVIQKALDDGVTMALTAAGQIEITGDQPAIDKWLPTIREHKSAIVAALQDDPAVTAIKAWLTFINETDPVMITECIHRCATDPDALAYFLWRSAEVPMTDAELDKLDAIECGQTFCGDCRLFRGDGRVCGANRCPTPSTLFRRCEHHMPKATLIEKSDG